MNIEATTGTDQDLENSYLIETVRDKATMTEPFPGVTFPPDQVAQADRLEIYGSKYNPSSDPDFCMYRLMKGDKQIACLRKDGF